MATDNQLGTPPIRLAATFLIAIAALNMGMVEFLDVDLFLELGIAEGTGYSAAIAAVATGGALTAYNTVVEALD